MSDDVGSTTKSMTPNAKGMNVDAEASGLGASGYETNFAGGRGNRCSKTCANKEMLERWQLQSTKREIRDARQKHKRSPFR